MSYKDLKSYQNSVIIYDFTVEFCKKYIRFGSRTRDQMEQAARSGKQNIVEGSATESLSTAIKLTMVARGSLEELLEDYHDYLRQNNLKEWEKDSEKAREVRNLVYRTYKTYKTYESYINQGESACNAMVTLISQTTYLLDNQIKSLKEKFVKEGGFTENLAKKRFEYRREDKGY